MATRKAKSKSEYPPNPAQWPPERHGLQFRQRFSIPADEPLRPYEIGRRFADVKLLRRDDLEGMVAPDDLAEAFGPASRRWSAVTVPIPGDGFVIIMNDTHAPTRQNATLMEEFFHIVLNHKPTRIRLCPATGLMRREFNRTVENEAYWSAAAALVPYAVLRQLVDVGRSIPEIASHFEVSNDLVEFRLKITKLWRRAFASTN